MSKPPLPTSAEIRTYCRANYGHWSNISREWLKTQTNVIERIGTYGYSEIDREMAELFEADWFTLTDVEQDVFIDWYANHYRGAMYDSHGDSSERRADPNREDPMYGLVGISTGWWTPDTCADRGCKIKITGGVWHHTFRTCPAHSAVGDALLDTVLGENGRKNTLLAIVEALIDKETRDNATWAFTFDRLPGSDERVLEVTITGTNKQQRDSVEGAADVQFSPGAIRVL